MFKPAWMNSQTKEGKCSYNDREFFLGKGVFSMGYNYGPYGCSYGYPAPAPCCYAGSGYGFGYGLFIVLLILLLIFGFCWLPGCGFGFGGSGPCCWYRQRKKLGPSAEFSHLHIHFQRCSSELSSVITINRHTLTSSCFQWPFSAVYHDNAFRCTGRSVSRYPSPANSNASLLLHITSSTY